MICTIRKISDASSLNLDWQNPAWRLAPTLELKHFRPEGSTHRPLTSVRLLHDGFGIHGLFQVQDQFVRCTRTDYGSEVWKDACVEFFIEPRPGSGYFNFEFNCGGAFLCNHIIDPARAPGGFKNATRIPVEAARVIRVRSSLPRVVDPEITEPVTWTLQFFFPFALLEPYVSALGNVSGQSWRGNLFKCAEDNSHPHWASWLPVDEFNFHRPHCFGVIELE